MRFSQENIDFQAITTDSRKVRPGSFFIAIAGDSMDGHQFIPQAIQSGATTILGQSDRLTDSIKKQIPSSVKLFEVESSITAIREISKIYRDRFSIPVIAIVGAVGKTTTKELLASLLRGKYSSVLQTEGSQNGFLGIPLTLLQLRPDTQIAVIEIGIDEIGAMDQHMELVNPTHVILTANGPEHLHQLKTVEIAATEELKAFDFALKNNKKIAINLSDAFVQNWFQQNKSQLKTEQFLTYSSEALKAPSTELRGLTSPLPGLHHAHNLLAAITVAQFFDLTDSELKNGLSTFKTAFGRTEIHHLKNGTQIIADYYNSNPTSATAALQLLSDQNRTTGKRIAVLGDMLELGEQEELFHCSLAPVLEKLKIDSVLLYGPRMKWLEQQLKKTNLIPTEHFESHEQIAAALKPILTAHDSVLIKGSRGMKMEKLFALLQS